MRFFAVWVFIFQFSAFSLRGQDTVSFFRNSKPFKDYLVSYVTDGLNMAAAPVKWDQKDVLFATGAVTGTLVLWKFDEQIQKQLVSEGWAETFLDGIDHFGDGVFSIPVLAGIFVAGKATKTPYDCEVALLGLKTFALNAVSTRLVKYTFQRHRPTDDVPPDALAFEGPMHGYTGYDSFVSGHASSAFALAAVLSKAYGKQKKWVPWVVWPLASLVAFSRVYDGSHWASDAFAGAAFGYSTGMFMYHFNLRNR